jgi:hypothetical protein
LLISAAVLAVPGGLLARQSAQTSAPAQAAALPTAREIIDRYIKETGGTVAFKAIQSMKAKGTFTVTGQAMSGNIEMMAARPNKLLTKISVPGIGAFEEGFDGKVAWSIDPLNGPSLITGRALNEHADEAWFDAPLHGTDHVKDMTVLGKEVFEGRPVYRVKVVSQRGTEQIEFFDVATGLQAGLEATRETPMGTMPTTAVFGDYRRFGQLTFPAKMVQRVFGQEQVVTFSAYEFDSVPASAFDLPAVIKALIK